MSNSLETPTVSECGWQEVNIKLPYSIASKASFNELLGTYYAPSPGSRDVVVGYLSNLLSATSWLKAHTLSHNESLQKQHAPLSPLIRCTLNSLVWKVVPPFYGLENFSSNVHCEVSSYPFSWVGCHSYVLQEHVS